MFLRFFRRGTHTAAGSLSDRRCSERCGCFHFIWRKADREWARVATDDGRVFIYHVSRCRDQTCQCLPAVDGETLLSSELLDRECAARQAISRGCFFGPRFPATWDFETGSAFRLFQRLFSILSNLLVASFCIDGKT
jgi:hypothetical protein